MLVFFNIKKELIHLADEQYIPLSVLREYMPKLKDEDLKELGPIEYDQSKVPEVSKKHAENVRRKAYLPDMTESFARGLEYAGLIANEAVDISNETKGRQDTVETQFNSVQQELTDKDPISAPELIAARNGEANLKARLDKEQQQVNAQLARKGSLEDLTTQTNLLKTIKFENEKDGGYSWWTYPTVSRPTGVERDKTFFTFVNRNSETMIASLDNDTGDYEEYSLVKGTSPDEHNTGAIQFDNYGRVLVAYTLHNNEKVVRISRSVRPYDITEFEPVNELVSSGLTTYAQFYKMAGEFFLFYRVDSLKWAYRRSNDGVSWGAEVVFLTADVQYYVRAVQWDSPQNFRLYIYGHPYASTDKSIRYGTFKAITNSFHTLGDRLLSDGTTNLPVQATSFDVIAENQSANIRLFDGAGDSATIAYAKFSDSSASTYHVGYYVGGELKETKICDGGKTYDPNFYFGGVFFDPKDSNVVYVARESKGAWFVERYRTHDKINWVKEEIIDSSTSNILYRPFLADGAGGKVIYNKGKYNSYVDYTSHINIR